MWLANVLHLSDALDEADSEFAYFRSGRIMHIERHAFHPERLQDETVFRVRQVPEVYIYATERFKRAVEEAGLSGLRFLAT